LGRGLVQQPVLGHDGGRVGLRGTRALGSGAERALSAGPQPAAQRVAPHLVALGLQLGPQAASAIPPGMARKRLLCGRLPAGNWRRAGRSPLVVAAAAYAQHPAQISQRTGSCLHSDKQVLTRD